jgi:hypothetical protein
LTPDLMVCLACGTHYEVSLTPGSPYRSASTLREQ